MNTFVAFIGSQQELTDLTNPKSTSPEKIGIDVLCETLKFKKRFQRRFERRISKLSLNIFYIVIDNRVVIGEASFIQRRYQFIESLLTRRS